MAASGATRGMCIGYVGPEAAAGGPIALLREGDAIAIAPNAFPAAPAWRPARPRMLNEKAVIEIGTPEHSVVTTCAYCGVGCSFKAGMQATKSSAWCRTRTARPIAATPASRVVFRGVTQIIGPDHQTDAPREDFRSVAGVSTWDEAIATPRRSSNAFRPTYLAAARSAASPLRAAPTKRRCAAEARPRYVRQQHMSTRARACAIADGVRPEHDLRHLGRNAGFRLGGA